jgi:hypothetical protein
MVMRFLNGIYIEYSNRPVFMRPLEINLNFKMLDFTEKGNLMMLQNNPFSMGENQQQTQFHIFLHVQEFSGERQKHKNPPPNSTLCAYVNVQTDTYLFRMILATISAVVMLQLLSRILKAPCPLGIL